MHTFFLIELLKSTSYDDGKTHELNDQSYYGLLYRLSKWLNELFMGLYEISIGLLIFYGLILLALVIFGFFRALPEWLKIPIVMSLTIGLIGIISYVAYLFYVNDSWIWAFLFMLWAGYGINGFLKIIWRN